MQLSLNKALNIAAIGSLLGHCRKIIGHFKHSSTNKYELENQQNESCQKLKSVQQDVPTKWNFTFYVITSLLKNRNAIAETLNLPKTKFKVLNAAEWEKLSALKLVLEPCLSVTELLGGENMHPEVLFSLPLHIYRHKCILLKMIQDSLLISKQL